jgi:hypothetical protein
MKSEIHTLQSAINGGHCSQVLSTIMLAGMKSAAVANPTLRPAHFWRRHGANPARSISFFWATKTRHKSYQSHARERLQPRDSSFSIVLENRAQLLGDNILKAVDRNRFFSLTAVSMITRVGGCRCHGNWVGEGFVTAGVRFLLGVTFAAQRHAGVLGQ